MATSNTPLTTLRIVATEMVINSSPFSPPSRLAKALATRPSTEGIHHQDARR